MLGFDETITVYNKLMDEITGNDIYYRTVIRGCSWSSQHITGQNDKAFMRENVRKIRIPYFAKSDKSYVPHVEFNDPEKQYTLKEGDKIIKGESSIEMITGGELEGKFADICTVKAIHNNRRVGLKHLYVEG